MLSPSQTDNKVIAIYREPMKLGSPQVDVWAAGSTVLDIIDKMRGLPDDFVKFGVVRCGEYEVPFDEWAFYVPRPFSEDNKSIVTFHMPLQGGGGQGGGSKGLLSIIAAIALVFVTAGIASGALLGSLSATLGASLGIGATAGASLLAAGVSIVGSLVLHALSGPPVTSQAKTNNANNNSNQDLGAASIAGNQLDPNAPIPRVVGTRRIFPPFAFEPTTEIIGQNEFVNAVYVLAGPHKLENIRLGQASVETGDNGTDLVLDAYDGMPGSTPPRFPKRQSRTFNLGTEMSVHGTDPTDLSKFQPPLPVWHAFSTADTPDEAWLHIMMFGLIKQDAIGTNLRVPFRIHARRRGDVAWRDLPEFHYVNSTQQQTRLQVKFIFTPQPGGLPQAPAGKGFVEARKFSPGQVPAPAGSDFNADPYFSAGAGNDVYTSTTYLTTNVRNMALSADTVIFYLDPAFWPSGVYDIEIKRGSVLQDSLYTSATYVYNSQTIDFFSVVASNTLPLSRNGILDRFNLTRAVSVRAQTPLQLNNVSYLTLTARNRSVDQLSVLASGYVQNWNGTDWSTVETTSNPAAHYRDVLTGSLNFDPLPYDIMDIDAILDWWTACDTNNYTCDMVCEGTGLADVLRIMASCGYAQPYQSELWGVIRDYDRSAETPIQIFGGRNVNNFSWKKAFPRLPAGFLISYTDENFEYSTKQITVYRQGVSETDARLEQTAYEGLIRIADIQKRGTFDLRQAQLRAATYSFDAPAEYIRCRRGSLVGVNHDILLKQYGAARILSVQTSGANITGVTLDEPIDTFLNAYMQAVPVMQTVPVMQNVGLNTGIAIRQTDGTTRVLTLSNTNGNSAVLVLSAPISNDTTPAGPFDSGTLHKIDEGCLVLAGLSGQEYKRMIVTSISPSADLSATVTLVDEAPSLWSA